MAKKKPPPTDNTQLEPTKKAEPAKKVKKPKEITEDNVFAAVGTKPMAMLAIAAKLGHVETSPETGKQTVLPRNAAKIRKHLTSLVDTGKLLRDGERRSTVYQRAE